MIYDPISIIKCSRCKEWKSLTAFGVNSSRPDGRCVYCKVCQTDLAKKYYEDHREDRKAYNQKYHTANRGNSIQKSKDYRQTNRSKVNKINRDWRARHPDQVKAAEKRKMARHPEFMVSATQRRRARKSRLPSNMSSRQWVRCLDYFGGKCAICDKPAYKFAADHWIPLSDKRSDNPGTVATNILPLCHGINGCNGRKYTHDPLEWVMREFGPKQAQIILDRVNTYFEWVRQQDSHN